MRNRNEAPATILANTEVFDYLKEKVGERKTRTEAYCDLLDKSLAGFVSPFLRKQDYDLGPCQCHVTVSDLASGHARSIRAVGTYPAGEKRHHYHAPANRHA